MDNSEKLFKFRTNPRYEKFSYPPEKPNFNIRKQLSLLWLFVTVILLGFCVIRLYLTVYTQSNPEKVIVCYYNVPNSSVPHQLLPDGIHPHLCTHINVAFAGIKNKTIHITEPLKQTLHRIVKLRNSNPKLKILLSIGGSGKDTGFPEMVQDHASRKVFIRSMKYILRNFTLDGIDLDWEFPGVRADSRYLNSAKRKRERQHFSQLLREIRAEYIREKHEYLLTVAVAAPEVIVNMAYDIDQLNLYADFVNIMTYDFHFYSKYTPLTGLNAPVYPRSTEYFYLATLNINYTVHMYMSKGMDQSKIVVGIPTYGHTFTLVNENNNKIGSPASGYGTLGSLGFVLYPDICLFLEHHDAQTTMVQDEETKVPYFYTSKEWVSFDNPQSVVEKATLIKTLNLRGAMIYSLSADDFEGVCRQETGNGTKFLLSQSIKNTLSIM